ncbi:FtsK/SpoIIIE domain-containing protein [Gordonia sihwensis]|uniref:FtsK/SpoIIIE domain-containing protein n=1 Tax=Gordonia sihwensis TaxID=173559 RepID=UPI003D982E78
MRRIAMVGNSKIDREAKKIMGENPDMKLLTARKVAAERLSTRVASSNPLQAHIHGTSGAIPTFLEVLGIDDLDSWDPRPRWAENEHSHNTRFPIGYVRSEDRDGASPTSVIQYMNFAEMARGGYPHGAMQGITGSGKTFLTIGWILALAANYSPTRVNVALAGAKEFNVIASEFGSLPHVRKSVAGLGGDNDSSAELAKYLQDEIDHRQKCLADAGAGDIYEYRDKLKEQLARSKIGDAKTGGSTADADKADADKAGGGNNTVKVGDRDVRMPSAKHADMIKYLMADDNGQLPTVREAAQRAGFDLPPENEDIGERVPSPAKFQPGDLIIGDKQQGVYTGDGRVYTSDGEEIPLSKITMSGAHQGLFHLPVGDDGPAPLPVLIVFIEDWSSIPRDGNTLRRTVVDALRLGRSLGIHLVFSDQVFAEYEFNSEIWNHLMFRLSLNSGTATLGERMVGDPNAERLPLNGAALIQYRGMDDPIGILSFNHEAVSGAVQRKSTTIPEGQTVRNLLVDRIVEAVAN